MLPDAIADVRLRIRRALEARRRYVQRMQSGSELRYGAALLASPDGNRFHLITMHESVTATAGLMRRIAEKVVWVWCSTPMILDSPTGVGDHEPVTRLRGIVMIYPHGPTPSGYTTFDIELCPDVAELDPLVIGMKERPPGWPP